MVWHKQSSSGCRSNVCVLKLWCQRSVYLESSTNIHAALCPLLKDLLYHFLFFWLSPVWLCRLGESADQGLNRTFKKTHILGKTYISAHWLTANIILTPETMPCTLCFTLFEEIAYPKSHHYDNNFVSLQETVSCVHKLKAGGFVIFGRSVGVRSKTAKSHCSCNHTSSVPCLIVSECFISSSHSSAVTHLIPHFKIAVKQL